MDFETWMNKVDKLFARVLMGCDSNDLPDQNYYFMWEDEYTPIQAVKEVLSELGYDS